MTLESLNLAAYEGVTGYSTPKQFSDEVAYDGLPLTPFTLIGNIARATGASNSIILPPLDTTEATLIIVGVTSLGAVPSVSDSLNNVWVPAGGTSDNSANLFLLF